MAFSWLFLSTISHVLMPTAKYLIFNSKSTDSVKGHGSIIKAVYNVDPNMLSQPLLSSSINDPHKWKKIGLFLWASFGCSKLRSS
jgi:hypothetical protein